MNSKHTPGPWGIKRNPRGSIIKTIGPCTPDEYAGSAWLDVSDEDARLIAAAPELLEALKGLLSSLPAGNEHQGWEAEAVAAIAKATGEVE